MTPEQIERVRQEFDLHLPMHEQYWNYVTGILTGDLGNSVLLGMPVWGALIQRLPWTLLLMGCAIAFSTLVGTVLGVLSAWRRGKFTDIATMGGVLFLGSLPPFWLAMMLIVLFSTTLGRLPSFVAYQLGVPSGSFDWYVQVVRRLIMPAT